MTKSERTHLLKGFFIGIICNQLFKHGFVDIALTIFIGSILIEMSEHISKK